MEFGTFSGSYSAKSRFEEGEGTNPEELIAAAHAGCFSMALSLGLEQAGHPRSRSRRRRTSTSRRPTAATRSAASTCTRARRSLGWTRTTFQRVAEETKSGCPVSKALAAVGEINLDAQLED